MGVETFGRASFVAVTQIEASERDAIVAALAQHFVDIYGAPSVEAAMGVAQEEISQMMSPANSLRRA